MKKRLFAMVLALTMVLTLMPSMAFATDTDSVTITSVSYSGGENGRIKDAGYSGGVRFSTGETLTIQGKLNGADKTWVYTCSVDEYNMAKWTSTDPDAPVFEIAVQNADGYESVAWNGTYTYQIIVDHMTWQPNYLAKKTIMDWDNDVDHIGYSCIFKDGSVVLYSCDRAALADTTDIVIPTAAVLADGVAHTVKKINSYALGGLSNLKSVTIPASVVEMERYAVGYTVDGWEYDKSGTLVPKNPVKNAGFVIYGTKGSVAEVYANENGFIFKEVNDKSDDPKKKADEEEAAKKKADEDAALAAKIEAELFDALEWNGTASASVPGAKSVKAKASNKKVIVSWSKASKKNLKKFDKVEIQVCPDKGFARTNTKRVEVKKNRKTCTVKGLAKKTTYYVRVRDVKGSGAAKVVSKWSKVKKIKIK